MKVHVNPYLENMLPGLIEKMDTKGDPIIQYISESWYNNNIYI